MTKGEGKERVMSNKIRPVTEFEIKRIDLFLANVKDEYIEARKEFGPFDNGHEGLAVIWEEFEELKQIVFGHPGPRELTMAYLETIQLAAMSMAFCIEVLQKSGHSVTKDNGNVES